MAIEPGVLPELVTYCLSTIQKDDKSSFKNVLYGLRGNLKIEKLKFRRGDNRFLFRVEVMRVILLRRYAPISNRKEIISSKDFQRNTMLVIANSRLSISI